MPAVHVMIRPPSEDLTVGREALHKRSWRGNANRRSAMTQSTVKSLTDGHDSSVFVPDTALSWRSWLPTLMVFELVYVVSCIHRQIPSIAVAPLKQSLGLGDFQIGLLLGVAFTMVLAVAPTMTAPLVDRGNRVRLVAICMLIWSSVTIACGFVPNFQTLLVARMALAFAQSIVPLAVLSIICDIAPRASVPRAAALFMAAPYIGSGGTLLLGGPLLAWLSGAGPNGLTMLSALEPWRALFLILGAPGIIIALLVWAGMREPARRDLPDSRAHKGSVWPFLREKRAFLSSLLCFTAMVNMVSYTLYAWMPTYLIRIHGLDVKAAGLKVGTVFVCAGIAGAIFGSWLMSRSTNERALSHVVKTMLRLFVVLGPVLILLSRAPTANTALVLLALAFFIMAAALTSVMTPLPLVAPAHLRARVTSVGLFMNAGVAGLGPLIVGAITDFVFASPDRIADSLTLTFAGLYVVGLIAGPRAARLAAQIDIQTAAA